MRLKFLKIAVYLFISASGCLMNAQQNVVANGIAFKPNLEVVEAQISKEKLLINLSEIDKDNPQLQKDSCTDCPDGKLLLIEIDFKREFKFPIKETDSVYIRFSKLQDNLAENNHANNQVESYESSRNRSEEERLAIDAEAVKKKGMEISKKMMEGKISPEEAEKQIMALVQPYQEDLDNATYANQDFEEYVSKPTYYIYFYNDEELTTLEAFSGYLYIKEFNKERLVVEYRGEAIEQCVAKRAASSKEQAEKCKATTSQFLPGFKLLREGASSVTIDVKIKEFINNR